MTNMAFDANGRKEAWSQLDGLSDREIAGRIISGLKTLGDFQPDLAHLKLFGFPKDRPMHFLDFGAGMLRNTVGLLEMSPLWRVVAYDTQEMLTRGLAHWRERLAPHVGRLHCVSSWDEAKQSGPYEAVVAFLALQHIDEPYLSENLADIHDLAPHLCVYGRRTLDDFKTGVWEILGRTFKPVMVTGRKINSFPVSTNLEEGYFDDHTAVMYVPVP